MCARCCGGTSGRKRIQQLRHKVFDLVMLGIGVGFFALAIGYVAACDRL